MLISGIRALSVALAAILLACAPARAEETVGKVTVVADTSSGSFLAMNQASLRQFERDLAEQANSVTSPEDPPIRLVVKPNWRSKEFRISTNQAMQVEIAMDAGVLTFTRNASELAGLLAYQIAQIRYQFEAAIVEIMESIIRNRSLTSSKEIRSWKTGSSPIPEFKNTSNPTG